MNEIILNEWSKESRKLIENKKGVYSVHCNDKCLYVGSSIKLVARLRRFYGLGFNSLTKVGAKFFIKVILCDELNELDKIEHEMILKYKPLSNKSLPILEIEKAISWRGGRVNTKNN